MADLRQPELVQQSTGLGYPARSPQYERAAAQVAAGPEVSLRGFAVAKQAAGNSLERALKAASDMTRMGNAMFTMGVEKLQKAQETEAYKKEAEMLLGLDAELQEMQDKHDPRKEDFSEKALEIFDRKASEMRGGLSPFQQEMLDNRLTSRRLQVAQSALEEQGRMLDAAEERDLVAFINLQSNRILINPNAYEEVMADTMEAIDASDLSAEEKEIRATAAKEEIAVARVQSLLQGDNYAAASALLKDDETLSLISPKMVQAIQSDIKAGARRAEREDEQRLSEARNARYYDLTRRIQEGADVTALEIDEAVEVGALTYAQGIKAQSRLLTARKNQEKDAEDIAAMNALVEEGKPVPLASVGAVNKAFAMHVEQGADPVRTASVLLSNAGIVPSGAKRMIGMKLAAGTPEALIEAVAMADALHRVDPTAEVVSGAREKEALRLAKQAASGGGEVMALRVNEYYSQEPQLRQMRKNGAAEIYKNRYKDISGTEAKNATESIALISQEVFTREYMATGDEDIAIKETRKFMDSITGTTTLVSQAGTWFGNAEKTVLYPPETTYGMKAEDIRAGAVSDIAAAKGLKVNAQTIELDSDLETAREGQAGQPPSYGVFYVHPITQERTLLTDARGVPIRYKPKE
jgi:hypothetical protein